MPTNLTLLVNDMNLRVEWEAPERGMTNEQIQNYVVECSFMQLQDDEAYTLQHTVRDDTFEASLPIAGDISTAGYNCCVEAVFESYSSRACIAAPSQLIIDDDQQELLISCPQNTMILQVVAGVLTSVIAVLLILLLVAVVILIYMWKRIVILKIKEDCITVTRYVVKLIIEFR